MVKETNATPLEELASKQRTTVFEYRWSGIKECFWGYVFKFKKSSALEMTIKISSGSI